jgi:flagellar motor switch protein FliG
MIPMFNRTKKPAPRFSFLFKALSPREFFFYFQNEYPQTMAFILSFAQNRGYVKKVIALVQDEDAKHALTDYLYSLPRKPRSYNPGFVAAIEAETQRMLNLQTNTEATHEQEKR